MTKISEAELRRICDGIREDRAAICRHNPLGTEKEILLWMLLSCLVSYLSLSENETPCFTGAPTAETYRHAILYVLESRKIAEFDEKIYLERLIAE